MAGKRADAEGRGSGTPQATALLPVSTNSAFQWTTSVSFLCPELPKHCVGISLVQPPMTGGTVPASPMAAAHPGPPTTPAMTTFVTSVMD